MNKRTQILKQITSDQPLKIIESKLMDHVDIQTTTGMAQQAHAHEQLLDGHIPALADQLKIKPAHLRSWLDGLKNATVMSQYALLHLIERYNLDPLLEEVDLVQYEDQSWQAIITPQGYARLINACPQFKGISYTYSDADENAISSWIECAIYRSDRDGPITVREYYAEVKRDSAIWQKMPRRMLRNRAFQQCAKLALGI